MKSEIAGLFKGVENDSICLYVQCVPNVSDAFEMIFK